MNRIYSVLHDVTLIEIATLMYNSSNCKIFILFCNNSKVKMCFKILQLQPANFLHRLVHNFTYLYCCMHLLAIWEWNFACFNFNSHFILIFTCYSIDRSKYSTYKKQKTIILDNLNLDRCNGPRHTHQNECNVCTCYAFLMCEPTFLRSGEERNTTKPQQTI